MDIDNRRRGACDRCRGQKLRCVGSANPIIISGSRFQRNEIPCERCKRAKVECYSAGPAPRRTVTSDKNRDKQTTGPRPERPPVHQSSSIFPRSPNLAAPRAEQSSNSRPFNQPQRSISANLHDDQQSDLPCQNVDVSSAMPTASTEWMAYPPGDDMDWNDLNLETPIWMLDSDQNSRQDSVMDSLGAHDMINQTSKATSEDWNSDQFDIDASPSLQSKSTMYHARGPSGSPDRRTNSSSQTRRRPQQTYQTQDLESTKSCIQELARLNEILLREKSSLEEMTMQNGLGTSLRPMIGQTLHHCQDFLLILRRLKRSCLNSSPSTIQSRTGSEWSYSSDATDRRSHRGSPSFSSSSRSSLASLSPAAPSLEIPTLLSILSCYAYILQSYDCLFTPILDAITRSTPTIPATLTGLHLDGFELDDHNSLQLECLTSVSLNMLEKIEIILIGSPRQGGLFSQAKGGLLRDKLFAGLIDALYDQNDQKALSHGNVKQEVRAKRLIREIQAALRVIDI